MTSSATLIQPYLSTEYCRWIAQVARLYELRAFLNLSASKRAAPLSEHSRMWSLRLCCWRSPSRTPSVPC